MRRLSSGFLLVLLLTACGGSAPASSGVSCKEQYWDGSIGTCLPAGWQVVPREKITARGLPAEVTAAFQRDTAVSGQTPVLLVTKQVLTQDIDTKAYSDASIRSVTGLAGYKLIDTRAVKIDGKDAQIHVFTAQPNTGEPAHRFYQLSVTTKGAGYTYTVLTPLSVDATLEGEVLLMLQHATLTAPTNQSSS